MKKIHIFISQHKYFYLLLLLIPLQIWFQYLELTLIPQYMTQTQFDRKIPFIKEFVIPYLTWFVFVPYGVIYVGLHSKRDFYKLFVFLFGGMAVANLMFTLFPNAQDLRPVLHSTDPFSLLVKGIYMIDPPTNVCPSLHVIDSIAANTALQHSEAFSSKKYGRAVSSSITVLICLSTVLIKQHAIFDVICGIIVAAFFYLALYRLPFSHFRETYAQNSSISGRAT